jgi:hypothetical protein
VSSVSTWVIDAPYFETGGVMSRLFQNHLHYSFAAGSDE